jgi:hypothetical protein
MPYRRLPNTDSSRLRAMQKALQMSEGVSPLELTFSPSTYQELNFFYPEFNQAVLFQKETLERQIKKSKTHQEKQRKVKLYISHFIQVLNFAIIRGELKPEIRECFNLQEYDKKLPLLNTEKDIIEWGERMINGEQQRLMNGGTPITNPTIARVKVHYEDYLRTYKNQQYLQEAHNNAQQKIFKLRQKADAVILKLWNEIENNFSDLPPEEKRANAEKYGVVYFYRKQEKLNFSNLKLDMVM